MKDEIKKDKMEKEETETTETDFYFTPILIAFFMMLIIVGINDIISIGGSSDSIGNKSKVDTVSFDTYSYDELVRFASCPIFHCDTCFEPVNLSKKPACTNYQSSYPVPDDEI
ncbi:MAG: hypothetical protein LBG80_09430 [Bacteroidales bacterium]|jgi:hypothetical protein|nr:hypothetical protein [Bacteroidales bacterium]